MARPVQFDEDDDFLQSCGRTKSEREFSNASTALPSSPLLSRMVSPEDSHEFEEIEVGGGYELSDRPDEICKVRNFEEIMEDMQGGSQYPVGGLADEFVKTSWCLRAAVEAAGISEDIEEDANWKNSASPKCLIASFGVGILSRCLYGWGICTTLCVILGILGALMVLPGIYLYVMDGCRPEEAENIGKPAPLASCIVSHEIEQIVTGGALGLNELPGRICDSSEFRESMRTMQHGCAKYPIGGLADEISQSCRFLGSVAGDISGCFTYGHKLGGCENNVDKKDGVTTKCLLMAFVVGVLFRYLCNLGILSIIYALMGVVAMLLVLPGMYLYVVDGCRPEDYDAKVDKLSLAFSASEQDNGPKRIMNGIQSECTNVPIGGLADEIDRTCQLIRTNSSLAEFTKDLFHASRPDDSEAYGMQQTSSTSMCVLVSFGIGILSRYLYRIGISSIFCAVMGVVAALMVLPGIYLYVMDGCRPEESDEKVGKSSRARREGCGEFDDIAECDGYDFSSSEDQVLMASSALEETMEKIRDGSAKAPIGGLADEVSKSFKCLHKLPDVMEMNEIMPDGYRLVNGEEYSNQPKRASISCLLVSFALGFLYRYLPFHCFCYTAMSVVAGSSVLPGIYLYVVDGCRPEDCDETVKDSNTGEALFWLMILSLGSVYGACISGTFCIFMGTIMAFMVLPGIYLLLVDGCTAEECEDV